MLGRYLDRLVEAGAFEQVEARHELLGLRERAVGHQRLAAAHAHRHRRLWEVQLPAEQPHAAALHLLHPAGALALHDSQVLPCRQAVTADDEKHVLHLSLALR